SNGLFAKYRPSTSSVGSLRRPSLTRSTSASASGDLSISTSRNSIPRSFRKSFVLQQSLHHRVQYIVVTPIQRSPLLPLLKMLYKRGRFNRGASQCGASDNFAGKTTTSGQPCNPLMAGNFLGRAGNAALRSGLQACQRTIQRQAGAIPVPIRGRFLRHLTPGSLQRRPCPHHVDFLRALASIGQHNHSSRQYFDETPDDRKVFHIAAFAIRKRPNAKLGEQRGVPRQDAHVSFLTGQFDRLHSLVHHK